MVYSIVQDITIDAEGLGFNSWAGQCRQRLATAATFLRSCVAQASSLGEGGFCHSLHASA